MKFRFAREAVERDTLLLVEGDAGSVAELLGSAPQSFGLLPGEAVFVTQSLLLILPGPGEQVSMFGPTWQVRRAEIWQSLAVEPEQLDMNQALSRRTDST